MWAYNNGRRIYKDGSEADQNRFWPAAQPSKDAHTHGVGDLLASNAQTASAATARASLTPPRPAPKVVSYPSLAPDQVEKAPYRSPFDSPTI